MAAAQQGDQAAYRRFLTSVTPWLRKHAQKHVGDTHADDVVQETLMAIHKALHTYDPTRAAEPWLYTLLKYKILESWRRVKRHYSHQNIADHEFHLESDNTDPSINMDHATLMQKLPKEHAKVIELTKIEGLSIGEAAAEMNRTESWVKVTIHRSLKRLFNEVKEATQ